MTHLPFLAGAVAGVVMSSAFWFGLSVLWEALGRRAGGEPEPAAHRSLRAAVGVLFVVLAILPAYFLYRDESWTVLRGYGAGAATAWAFLFVELLRAAKSPST